jgi:tRNA-specific 2-thiouridylase
VFVTAIDPNNNTVTLGDEEDLLKDEMCVGKMNYIKYPIIEDGTEAVVKIRYRDNGTNATIYNNHRDLNVSFHGQAKGIAPGQSAVFYEGDDVLAGGIILRNEQINNQ